MLIAIVAALIVGLLALSLLLAVALGSFVAGARLGPDPSPEVVQMIVSAIAA